LLSRPENPRNRCGRQLLRLTAVLAVGVPGCLLYLTACGGSGTGQAHGQAQTQTQPRQDRMAVQSQRTQIRRKSSPLAVTLLTEAAQQGVKQTYWGQEEVVTRPDSGSAAGAAGGSLLISDVYHQSGGKTVTEVQATVSSSQFTDGDPDSQSPEGVLGVTTTLVRLLEDNYVLSYRGEGAVVNRPAKVVEAWRADGSLAAEFWLDTATKLPLEREVYDTGSEPISVGYFTPMTVGPSTAQPVFASGPKPQAPAWSYPIAPPKLQTFARQGWVVPAAMPGGLTLFTGGETVTTSGPVLDLAYSDGLYVVSVFEQHGKLPSKLTGWQKTKVAGQVVYAAVPDQRSFTWSGHGVVYTLIADAPSQTVAAVVGKLPHDEPPGFWKRISHGFARLAHMVNPFG
jgi:sigma-E factor negative regulatory protein RseB